MVLLSKQFIEAMRWTLSPTLGHIKAESPQTWCCHRDEQCRLALATSSEIDKPRGYDLVAGKIMRNAAH
jgi:hypothetical protein